MDANTTKSVDCLGFCDGNAHSKPCIKGSLIMEELIRYIRTLYLIALNSKDTKITIDADALKQVLDDLKKINKE